MPTAELHSVEVYRGGAMVRVYTVEYVERLARGKVRPKPIGGRSPPRICEKRWCSAIDIPLNRITSLS